MATKKKTANGVIATSDAGVRIVPKRTITARTFSLGPDQKPIPLGDRARGGPMIMGETRSWADLDRILQEKFGTSLAERIEALGGPKAGGR